MTKSDIVIHVGDFVNQDVYDDDDDEKRNREFWVDVPDEMRAFMNEKRAKTGVLIVSSDDEMRAFFDETSTTDTYFVGNGYGLVWFIPEASKRGARPLYVTRKYVQLLTTTIEEMHAEWLMARA